MNRIRALAQVVGFVTMGLLALYGLLALFGVAGPLGLAVEADEAAIIQGDTIPQTMNYQGFLREPDGSLITDTVTITARIWDQATGGTVPLYETTVPNVTVRDGLFNIVLGDDPALPADAFSDTPRYIGISLDGDPELIPRQRLHAAPWALTSATLVDDAQVQGLSSSGDITLSPGSDIIIEGGDIDATGNLKVTGDIDATGNLRLTGGMTVTRGLSVTGGLEVQPSLVVITRMLNIGNDADVDTGMSANEYHCVATGWSASWDFEEGGTQINMVWTYIKGGQD